MFGLLTLLVITAYGVGLTGYVVVWFLGSSAGFLYRSEHADINVAKAVNASIDNNIRLDIPTSLFILLHLYAEHRQDGQLKILLRSINLWCG